LAENRPAKHPLRVASASALVEFLAAHGEHAEALQLIEQTLAELGDAPATVRAETRLVHAKALAAAGRTTEARAVAERAKTEAMTEGAGPLVEKIVDWLAALTTKPEPEG